MIVELPNIPVLHDKAARLHYQAGRLPQARDHAAKAAAGDRADPDAILFYAGILLALKDLPGAQTQLDRLTSLDPTGLPVADLKAKILIAQGKPTEAADVLERAFNDHAKTPEALFIGEKTIRMLFGIKQYEAASRIAQTLADTGGPLGQCLLAESIVPLGKLDQAAELLDKAAKAGATASAGSSALNLAIAPKADPRWLAIADKHLSEAAKAKPASIEVLKNLATVRHFQGKFDQEVLLFHQVRERNPDNYEFLNNLAWTLSENLNRPDLGLKWIDEAVKKAGDHPHIRDTRGVILTHLGKYDDAIKDLTGAARDLPSGAVYYHLAAALLKAKRPQDARPWQDLARKSGLSRDQLQPTELTDWDAVMTP
jgi:tetratricopeptide (TPR) repeat protein